MSRAEHSKFLARFLSEADLASFISEAADTFSTIAKQYENHALAPLPSLTEVKSRLNRFNFTDPVDVSEVLSWTATQLCSLDFRLSDPHYFGVFNPNPSAMGIVGDLYASARNSQLASAVSSPFGVLVEDHLIRFFGEKLRLNGGTSGGVFTSGGTEANYTAVLSALAERFPEFEQEGVRGLPASPRIYVSTETHHSFLKAAKMAGLGLGAVVEVPVTAELKLDCSKLEQQIAADKRAGLIPFLIVGTLGSTSAGVVDDLAAIANVAKRHRAWFHVDAAWGGAACLLPECADLFSGCESADSLTLDAHKWLNVPMTAGMFFCRRERALEKAFRVIPSPYMPKDSEDVAPPYHRSLGWSRRFTGLKLFMSLAAAGVTGFQQTLRHQIKMGDELRELLKKGGWKIENETRLPVVCFSDPHHDAATLSKRIAATGKTWVTTTQLTSTGKTVLRAGISNAITQPEHLATLVELLHSARESAKA